MKSFPVVLILYAGGMAACNDPVAETASDTPRPLASVGAVVASATGGIQRIRADELWVLGFNAVLHEDGSATGTYHVDRQDLGISFDVEVTCMSVVGNTAWIAGIIHHVKGPLVQEGTVSYFYVTDNGEGEGAPVDIASAVRINDAAGQDEVFCTDRPVVLPSGPIDFGNAQVQSR